MNNLGDSIAQLAIVPIATVAANGDSTGFDLHGAVTANPSTAKDYEGEMALLLDSLNGAGTLPTLAVKLQHSDVSGSGYVDVTGGAFTGLTTGAAQQKLVVDVGALKRYIRLDYVIGGTSSPSYTLSCQGVVKNKYPA
jgi:hypothetical protein